MKLFLSQMVIVMIEILKVIGMVALMPLFCLVLAFSPMLILAVVVIYALFGKENHHAG